MKIEPEALYSLFDTLFLPTEIIIPNDINATEEPTKKRVLMLFEKEYTSEEQDFLNKILAAINISSETVDTKFEITADQLPEIIEANSGYILIWGINFPEAENYKLLQNGKTSILVIDSLTAIKKDQSLKTKLWNALKAVFVK